MRTSELCEGNSARLHACPLPSRNNDDHLLSPLLQGIVVYLVKMLDRTNIELLILSTVFLKKLSIYQENKDQMAACDVVPRLVKLMAGSNEVLLMAVLRLLHNLSFDSNLQDDMVKQGLLPKVSHEVSIEKPLTAVLQLWLSSDSCLQDNMAKQGLLP